MDTSERTKLKFEDYIKNNNDYFLEEAFGSLNPCISQFPRCIFITDPDILRMTSELTGSKLGVWGNCLLAHDENGNFRDFTKGDKPEDFKLWASPKNQEAVFREHFSIFEASFKVCIDANTPVNVLKKIFADKENDESESDWFRYTDINIICNNISELGWAYIPSGDEVFCAVFVTNQKNHSFVDHLIKKLLSIDSAVCHLIKKGNRCFLEKKI